MIVRPSSCGVRGRRRGRIRVAARSPATDPVLVGGLAASVALFGCQERSPGDPGWGGAVDTLPNDVVHVSNPPQGLWREGEGWRLTEELRIGSIDREGPELFGDIPGIAAGEDGRIYVLERQAREVRIFGPDGVHLRTVGGQGGGPGEFGDPVGVGWGEGGNLWVLDPGNARYSLFDPEGVFLESRQRPIGGYMLPWPGAFSAAGEIFDVAFLPDRPLGSHAFVRFSPDLERADTIRLPEYRGLRFEIPQRISAPVPFSPGLLYVLDPEGGLWLGVNERFRLVRTTFAGDTILVSERPVQPERITAADREEAIEGLEWFTSQGGTVDVGRIPSTKPTFGTLLLDDRDHLWVAPFTQGLASWDRFDVIDPRGIHLGTIPVDPPVSSYPRPVFRDGRMYAVMMDELEVPHVVRFRIER